MIRGTGASLLLAVVAGAGCWPIDMDFGNGPGNPSVQAVGSALPVRPPPLITPEQVTEGNAHQKLEALRREMEEAQRDLPAEDLSDEPAPEKPAPKKSRR